MDFQSYSLSISYRISNVIYGGVWIFSGIAQYYRIKGGGGVTESKIHKKSASVTESRIHKKSINFIHSIKVFGGVGGALHLHLLFDEIVYTL